MTSDNVIVLSGVSKRFSSVVGEVLAVDDVSISLPRGGALGVIGETGSGKSTLGRIAVGLLDPDVGDVALAGLDLASLDRRSKHQLRTSVGIVFQEPYASLDPRRTVLASVEEPLEVKLPGRGASRIRRSMALEALERVGLDAKFAGRFPRMLSGGQQQRVGIARAIVTKPQLVLLDEPTSALDRSIRGDVLRLLNDLRRSDGLSYLVITHDVETVEALAEDIIVMYRGRIVERGRADQVLRTPHHLYTQALLGARLPVDPRVPLPPVQNASYGDTSAISDWG